MSVYGNEIREEELKVHVGEDWFTNFDCSMRLGNIDFCVALKKEDAPLFDTEALYWAEAKRGNKANIVESITQLVITIGKERTFEKMLPPMFVGCFDAEKIVFLEYSKIQHFFYQNDFNWNITPSNHETKEFKLVQSHVEGKLKKTLFIFEYKKDEKELKKFISVNFKLSGSKTRKIKINKNNFVPIFNRWLEKVKDSINIDWNAARSEGILPADFYLADLLSDNDKTLRERLFVLLESDQYRLGQKQNSFGGLNYTTVDFMDNQKAYNLFWNKYERPPKREYWNYIIDRRDILVPQDIRETRGSYFTPKRWVDLSQEYMAKQFGEDWQDDYYIWDCAAGTGNLLANLTNDRNIWASTLDEPDVNAMKSIASNKGLNLLEGHIFKFDFLNDDLKDVPDSLRKIIEDPEKRKKLIIYINPPYKEPTNKRQPNGTGKNQAGVSESVVKAKCKKKIGQAINEMSVQFWMRVFYELNGCNLCSFATPKTLLGSQFIKFRKEFKADLKSLFLVPADTFDNVSGQFPIGFFIWDTCEGKGFKSVNADLYDSHGQHIGTKNISALPNDKYILTWLRKYYDKKEDVVAYLRMRGADVSNNQYITISNGVTENDIKKCLFTYITRKNLLPMCVYEAIRRVVEKNWLNDRDQYLVPEETWRNDAQFITDCLVYTLFENDFRREFELTNNWIPFSEKKVGAKDSYDSHFMCDILEKRTTLKIEKSVESLNLINDGQGNLFNNEDSDVFYPEYSNEAKNVLEAGKQLYRYYHQQPNIYVNASLRDIKLYFQGADDTGKMLTGSNDETYNALIGKLNAAIKELAQNIQPKIFEHGFMKK